MSEAVGKKGLGAIVRVIEVYFVLVMATILGYALLKPASGFEYDITLLRVVITMAAAARSVWLIEKRSDATRRYVVVSMCAVIVVSVLDMVFGGEYERISQVVTMPVLIAGGVLYFGGSVFIVGYFAFSQHAKELFVMPDDADEHAGAKGSTGAERVAGAAKVAEAASALGTEIAAGAASVASAASATSAATAASAMGVASAASAAGAAGAAGTAVVKSAASSASATKVARARQFGVRHSPVQPTSDTQEDIYEKPFTWPWFRNLGLYYCAFSIMGHWAEIGFCWLIVLGVVMGDYDFTHAQLWDWWLCPYPAEGIAVVLIALLLFPFKEWVLKKTGGRVWLTLIISFLVNMLVCARIDFTTGITANANFELWDYRDLPFNFMGQIVLQNTLVYSVAATFIVWVVYPLMAKWLHRMKPRYANGLFIGFVAFYLFLEVLYYVHLGPTGFVFG